MNKSPAKPPRPLLGWPDPPGVPGRPKTFLGNCEAGGEGSTRQAFLIPGLCPPRPMTLTMQLYSSSSISFTFRQYDCGAGEARLSEWLNLLDNHPDVPSSPPHATLPLSHPGEQPCQASWALYTPGWDKL